MRSSPREGQAPAEPGVIRLTGTWLSLLRRGVPVSSWREGARSEEVEWAEVVFGDGLIFPQRR